MNEKEQPTRQIARVAQVLDKYTIVINQGSADGVEEEDRFLIYGIGDEIKDPETGQSLGKLEIVRGQGVVAHVQERLATVKTAEKRERGGKSRRIKRSPGFSGIFGEQVVEEHEDYREESVPFSGVQIGDFAKPI